MDRRLFLSGCVSCSAHILGIANYAPSLIRSAFAQQEADKLVVKKKWGSLLEVADGTWGLISTPFTTRDATTVCNGGIVAGSKGVLCIESFNQAKGATWMAEQAKELTGRWPTDIVSTHFHGDHTAGHKGYFVNDQAPNVWLTENTKKAAEKSFKSRRMKDNDFKNVSTIAAEGETVIDLGDRIVKLINRNGHTPSDVTIEVVDPKVIFCGDLFFNRVFPNYSDATPSKLAEYAKLLEQSKDVILVPGHGPVADQKAVKNYQEFLAFVGDYAQTAHKAGDSIKDAAAGFKLPKPLEDWLVWSPQNARLAMNAWYKELGKKS